MPRQIASPSLVSGASDTKLRTLVLFSSPLCQSPGLITLVSMVVAFAQEANGPIR
jgi:hypothetical protein